MVIPQLKVSEVVSDANTLVINIVVSFKHLDSA